MNERIKLLMKKLELTQVEFSNLTGISQRILSNLVNSKSAPSYEAIVGILKAFPFVKSDWLLLGEGEITFPDGTIQTEKTTENNLKTTPTPKSKITTFKKSEIESTPEEREKYLTLVLDKIRTQFPYTVDQILYMSELLMNYVKNGEIQNIEQ